MKYPLNIESATRGGLNKLVSKCQQGYKYEHEHLKAGAYIEDENACSDSKACNKDIMEIIMSRYLKRKAYKKRMMTAITQVVKHCRKETQSSR